MKLLFKERFFSWLDSYDVFDESGNTVYSVEGQLSWGHCLHIHDAHGTHVATLKEKILTFLPKFELYLGDEREYLGCIQKEFTLFKPAYDIDFNGWHIEGDFSNGIIRYWTAVAASLPLLPKNYSTGPTPTPSM